MLLPGCSPLPPHRPTQALFREAGIAALRNGAVSQGDMLLRGLVQVRWWQGRCVTFAQVCEVAGLLTLLATLKCLGDTALLAAWPDSEHALCVWSAFSLCTPPLAPPQELPDLAASLSVASAMGAIADAGSAGVVSAVATPLTAAPPPPNAVAAPRLHVGPPATGTAAAAGPVPAQSFVTPGGPSSVSDARLYEASPSRRACCLPPLFPDRCCFPPLLLLLPLLLQELAAFTVAIIPAPGHPEHG